MTEHIEKNQPRSRVKKSSNSLVIVCLIIVAILAAGFYIYLNQTRTEAYSELPADSEKVIEPGNGNDKQSLTPEADGLANSETSSGQYEEISSTSPSEKPSTNLTPNSGAVKSGSPVITPLASENGLDLESIGTVAAQDKGLDNSSMQESSVEQTLTDEINNFYAHLDNQEYMKAYSLETSSKEHFSSLLQKLIDNPPVVTRETDDLYTLLKNTAHFFRILGKDNILMLKGILDREKDSFEKTLKSFYSLTKYPDQLAGEYSLVIPENALYDYAGFFINTMGGRLYLFRRDSTSRMTVSFYAILVIDSAKDAENDRHGLDLKGPINSLIEEIENAGNRLRLKEEYLDILYDLQEKYSY